MKLPEQLFRFLFKASGKAALLKLCDRQKNYIGNADLPTKPVDLAPKPDAGFDETQDHRRSIPLAPLDLEFATHEAQM